MLDLPHPGPAFGQEPGQILQGGTERTPLLFGDGFGQEERPVRKLA